jgi:hypothetical protein
MLEMMTEAARQLEDAGLILRSGAAKGADTAFEKGVYLWPNKQIFLPWIGFNGRHLYHPGTYRLHGEIEEKAREIAAKHHPNWAACNGTAQLFHTRNVAQVLGPNLDEPALFVLCWTPGGKGGGGTGQAIRIAKTYDVPIFDMGAMTLIDIAERIQQLL